MRFELFSLFDMHQIVCACTEEILVKTQSFVGKICNWQRGVFLSKKVLQKKILTTRVGFVFNFLKHVSFACVLYMDNDISVVG